MASAPQINFLDGSGTTQNLVLTTNLASLFFSGTIDSNTIDIQINLNDSGFVSDPTLVGFGVGTFNVPNLASYPAGLMLDKGANTIQLRAIDVYGSVSPISTISVNVVSDTDLGVIQAPPTGVSITRHATTVEIKWTDPSGGIQPLSTITFNPPTGYHVYASVGSGGTISGYLRLNQDMIPSNSATVSDVTEVPVFDESFDLSDPDGNDLVISSQTVDPVGGQLIDQKSLVSTSLLNSPNFRLRTTVSSLQVTKTFSFVHDRGAGIGSGTINNDTFGAVPSTDPIFYVVTAVYVDNSFGSTLESRFSSEISGSPLPLDTSVRGIRIRDQRTVTQDYITEIQKTAPTLALIPGSTVREVHIEPFANEIQKAYFLMDFVHRSKSFSALLQIDDPTLSGTPTPVSQSSYKQQLAAALSLTSDASVQALINGAFDSLAVNYGKTRSGLRSATVIQTYYTTTLPARDLIVAQDALVSSSTNSAAPRFRSRGLVRLTAIDAAKFYNQDTRRYEVQVEMIAETAGSVGNIPAGALDTVVSGATGLKTVNTVASDYGRDTWSNLQLAEACVGAYSSVDSGTAGGLANVCAATSGVLESMIVKAGDTYMMRDYDPVRSKHIGGKVDIYVKGTIERTVTEHFAFQFSIANNVRFDVIDATQLIFRARDSRLSINNPIQEVLYNPSNNLGLRNHSDFPTASYDLTGVVIIDYQTIQLNTSIPQPVTKLDDFVEGDYRYRSNNKFIAGIQPVIRVSSITGEISGALDPSLGFTLYKLQDPLLDGYSTRAQDYISINQVDAIPNGQPIAINNELHVLIGQFQEQLLSVGVNTTSLVVYSQDRSIIYNGPNDANPDYLIIEGSQTTPVKIIRSSSSQIANGATVSVDYEHDENFTVVYVVNDVLQQLQSNIETKRHVTADVLVKQAVENPLSTEATIQLSVNAVQSTVDDGIRSAITVLTDNKGIGESIYQSNISNKISEIDGVNFIVQPFSKLTLQDGAVRVREYLPSDYKPLPSLNLYANAVYILDQALPYATTDGGGGPTVHHGVFMDDLIMSQAPSLTQIAIAPYQAWIIGSKGAVINGYTDAATLAAEFVDPDDQAAAFLSRTANKVVVSLNAGISPPDVPTNHTFTATYIVQGDIGSKDINISSIEYLTPGSLTLTYRQG